MKRELNCKLAEIIVNSVLVILSIIHTFDEKEQENKKNEIAINHFYNINRIIDDYKKI